jgi:hypothetical protein
MVNDDYTKFNELECQYFELCKYYKPKECLYCKPCEIIIILGKKGMSIRSVLRGCLKSYVTSENLGFQIKELG